MDRTSNRRHRRIQWVALLVVVALTFTGLPDADAKGRSTGSRPNYSGSKHSTSHGGHYDHGQGSSHKGGSYRNNNTDNHYGKHKN